MSEIERYIHSFSSLRRGTTIYGPAPHKLVLLLAVIHDIETCVIKSNRITPSDQLVATFQSIWKEYVHSGHKLNFALPFYHLSNEGFWHLHAFPGKELDLKDLSTVGRLPALRKIIQYVTMDSDLFKELKMPDSREELKRILINCLVQDSAGICPFCQLKDADIIDENDLALAFYDRYPVSPGHTLIIPKRHIASFFSLNREEIWKINDLSLACKAIIVTPQCNTGRGCG